MAYSKNNLFSTELQECSEFYKALAHPARLAILKYLAKTTTCITGDLAEELPLVRTTVNQHLKGLKDAGLIIGTTEGVKTCYCINYERFELLKRKSSAFLEQIIPIDLDCKIP